MTAPRAAKAQSWDDFKAAAFSARTETIEGVPVPVPTDVPLGFSKLASELNVESETEDFAEVVALLYGDGVFDQWVANGMGATGLMVAIMWGYMQGSGKDVTFTDAFEVVMSDDPGKAMAAAAGNRAARRAQSKPTGGRSAQTSAGSMGSARRTSRS